MRIFVLIAVRGGDHGAATIGMHPPSVWQLQQCVRRSHHLSYRATTGAYLWSRDALFQQLHRVPLESQALSSSEEAVEYTHLYAALLDLGANEEEGDVVALLLTELCRAWDGDIAAHWEVVRPGHRNRSGPSSQEGCPYSDPSLSKSGNRTSSTPKKLFSVEREETLLVLLADAIESSRRSQIALLKRWGVESMWNYAEALQGRSWLLKGGCVAVLPAGDSTTALVEDVLSWELLAQSAPRYASVAALPRASCIGVSSLLFSTISTAAIRETFLTQCWRTYLQEKVAPQLANSNSHIAVVAVAPAVALLLADMPSSLLHDCVLHHCIDCPLVPVAEEHGGHTCCTTRDVDLYREIDIPRSVVVTPVISSNVSCDPEDEAAPSLPVEEQPRMCVASQESERLIALFREYDQLLSNDGLVRVPLSAISRYVFAQLLCQSELPSVLMLPFARCHQVGTIGSAATESASPLRALPTEEEIVLGIKLTWAVDRWSKALQSVQQSGGRQGCPTSPLPPFYSWWNVVRAQRRPGVAAWVTRHARLSQQAVVKLGPMYSGADHSALSRTVLNLSGEQETVPGSAALARTKGDLFYGDRVEGLARLTAKLFAPFTTSYRGSSTAWVKQMIQEAGHEFAEAAAASVKIDQGAPSGSAAKVIQPDGLLLSDASSVSDLDSASTSTAEWEEDSNALEEPGAAPLEEEQMATLLTQLTELEAVLDHQPSRNLLDPAAPVAAGKAAHKRQCGRVGGGEAEGARSLPSRLTAQDMDSITHNQLFMHHAELLQAEMMDGDSRCI